MKLVLVVITAVTIIKASTVASDDSDNWLLTTSADRIASNDYPVETHKVVTSDGYVLVLFRIPYSPKLKNKHKPRQVAFLQHGLTSISDCFLLNGPDNALAYNLADAGYDVWLGNTRGTTYTRKNLRISPDTPEFWDYSWNEIALHDMPTMIDYVLKETRHKSLHYVGHSQGTTVFFILMSSIPKYNHKIKTAHMLAPVAFMNNLKSPIVKLIAPILGKTSPIIEELSKSELARHNTVTGLLGKELCKDGSPFQMMCAGPVFAAGGADPKHFNYSLLPGVADTHPAGSSTKQAVHYLQEFESAHFRKYDHGPSKNKEIYGQVSPPDYKLKNIVSRVNLYYSDNDLFVGVEDVDRLAKHLPNVVEKYRIPIREWSHFDFVWGLEVKELINDKIISKMNAYEKHCRKHKHC